MKRLVDSFLRRVDLQRLPVEGIAAYEEDRLIVLCRRAPGAARNVYSQAKSVLSLAIGAAISDGVLSLGDTLGGCFADVMPPNADPAVAAITLRDLLCMASGLGGPHLTSAERYTWTGPVDYLRHMLSRPAQQAPGTRFAYSNGDSYLAGRMLAARTGQSVQTYAHARIFRPLGIDCPAWAHDPLGHTFPASGLFVTLQDMAKLGRLCLGGGKWDGTQVIDPQWIAQATAWHIATPDIPEDPWAVGYGYQFWRSPYPDAYRAHGLYGQVTTVLPRSGAVIAIQCTESDNFPDIRAALDEEILSQL